MLNKIAQRPLQKKTATHTHTHTKVCSLSFILLYSRPTPCLCGDVTDAQETRGPKRWKKKETSSRGARGNRKQTGESQAELVVKKNFRRERSIFYLPVILSSLNWQCSQSVAWTPRAEGGKLAPRWMDMIGVSVYLPSLTVHHAGVTPYLLLPYYFKCRAWHSTV